jgi:predicted enzyme related to lactoylglutathione lyase
VRTVIVRGLSTLAGMGERESYAPGTFCWVDLGTTDAAGAKAFYGRLFGWEPEDMPAGEGNTYTMLRIEGRDVAALYEQGADEREAGIPPHWSSYISVVDVDEVAARVEGLGGKLLAEPFDVLDSGRMAVVQDPTGALVSLWQAGRHIGARLVNDPGCLTWNDLATPDPDAAAAFYTALLGWEVQSQAPEYATITNEGSPNGGIRHETELPPHWLPYFTAESVTATAGTAREAGGQVLAEAEVPAGRIALILDPQGAPFAIFEGEVDD